MGNRDMFEQLLDGVRPSLAEIARELRTVILAMDSGAVEVIRLGDRAASYGVGPRKMSEAYAYIMPQLSHVNLGFYRGAQLIDPDGVLEGTGKLLRHVKVRSLAALRQRPIRQLLMAARVERERHFAMR